MPVKRRRGKARHLDDFCRQQLLEGPEFCTRASRGMGYLVPYGAATFADLTAEQRAEAFAAMREDWAVFGADLLAWWQSGEPDLRVRPWAWVPEGSPNTLPWAEETFGKPPFAPVSDG